jgi:hypothetical protein
MKRNIEPCANCPAEIYQASDQVFYHLKTGNKFCVVGSGYSHYDYLAGKVATPKTRTELSSGFIAEVPGNGF